MHIAGLPYWRLRDYLRGASRRQQRQRREQALQQAVQQTALEQPTYGYWRLYPALKARGWCVGRERVRRLLAALDLAPEHPSKKRRAAPGTATAAELPEGRRVQIDATRLCRSLTVWVYVVEDVTSQACLAASAGRRLSKERAAQALQEAHHFLRQGGIAASLVIQSDGGSEFTSEYFQQCCQAIRQWVRCRIDQAGDMGIVERLHRKFKYEFVFRHEVTTAVELKELAPRQRLLIDGAVLT